ncbi:MAG: Gfo/Idh/MocA family oxidoreductase [Sedimentisphaerales bacterium]|nr:Gfo/Idh/MocA family oxidoreductase [Sedimentisphaerales bacterium]
MANFKKAKDIKVGVVGYGGAFNMGKAHLDQMKMAGMTPMAVMDLDAGRLKEAEKDFPGIETYTSLAKMLKSDVNLIVLITPHNTHAKLALQCLKAGKHVVCEKPFAITTAECDAMIAAAKKGKLVLSTYHNRHWDGCILEAVDQVKKKKVIGDVVRVEAHMAQFAKPGDWWRSSKSISGGILYDWGVHLLEYTLQLMDADIVEVSGFAKTGVWAPKTKWKNDTNEDEGYLTVRYANGAWSTLCISQLDANPKRGWLEITGTKGTYVMVDIGTYEVITPKANGTVTVTKGNSCPGAREKFYQNIADHMVKGTPLVITSEWARRPIHILDLACQSAKKGKAMPAKYK